MSREPQVKKGDVVEYDDVICWVRKRRLVSGMAVFSTSEYEVYLETVDGEQVGWVGQNEVVKINDKPGDP